MDPLSITTAAASAVSALYTLSNTLYKFVQDSKNVNRTLKLLFHDVDSLIAVLKSIKHVLEKSKTVGALEASKGDEALGKSIISSLKSCEETAAAFCKILSSVQREDGEASTFVARSFLQLRLIRKREDVQATLDRMQSHKATLQLWLQSLTVLITINTPERVAKAVTEHIPHLGRSTTLTTISPHEQATKEEQVEGPKDDMTDDDRVEIAILQQSVTRGCELCDQQMFSEAESILRNSLKMLQEMDILTVDEACFRSGLLKLAIAMISQEKWLDAEGILFRLINLETPMASDDLLTSEACFYIAQIYLARHDFDIALEYCQRARVNQRRLLGKPDGHYKRSTRLLSLIFETRGDHVSSAAYRKFLPQEAWTDNSDIAVLPFTSQGIGISIQGKADAEKFLAAIANGTPLGKDPRTVHLRTAAQAGNLDVVRLLISRGVDVNSTDYNNATALRVACVHGHHTVAEFLIRTGADLNLSTKEGSTPLMSASLPGHADLVKLLLEHGAETDPPGKKHSMTALMSAAINGHTAVVKILIPYGAQLNVKTLSDEKTALTLAATHGHARTVDALILAGADVDIRDSDQYTPLIRAATRTHNSKVVESLLDAGADLAASTTGVQHAYGRNALHVAVENSEIPTAKVLLARGAAVEARPGRVSHMLLAVENKDADMVKLLLDHGADINTTFGSKSKTALHFAAANACSDLESLRLVSVLLKAGANPAQKDQDGITPVNALKEHPPQIMALMEAYHPRRKERQI